MVLELVDEDLKAEYDDLVRSQGKVFYTREWLAAFGDRIRIFGVFNKRNNMVGGFFLFEERVAGLKIFRNPPFTPFIGPVLNEDAGNKDLIRKVLTEIAEFINRSSFNIVHFGLDPSIYDVRPFFWRKFKVVPNYTYVIELEQDIRDILGRIDASRRRDIKKAEKDGLTVRINDRLDVVQELVVKTFLRRGKKINKEHLCSLMANVEKFNCFNVVVYRDVFPVSGALFVLSGDTCYYLLGGYDEEHKHVGAGPLAIWEAIKISHKMGLKYFDFEGSMIPGVERFFRSFGGEPKIFFRVNKAGMLLEILLKFWKREYF